MMQYMDKLALSQATMFNLREDLVCQPPYLQTAPADLHSTSKGKNTPGRRPSSTSDTLPGAGPVRTSSSVCRLASISVPPCRFPIYLSSSNADAS